MPAARLIRLLVASLVGLVFAAAVAWWSIQRDEGRGGSPLALTTVAPGVSIGGPFSLVDHTGAPVSDASYAGLHRLMFFGFTYCPDICPTELQTVARALDLLGADAAKVKPLFVSIDPGRDTPAQMAEYVALFHPAIVGLTGAPEQISAAAKAFRVYYAKAPGGSADSYTMDHSTYLYLMGPQGEFVTLFPRGTTAEDIAATVRKSIETGARR